LLYCDKMLMLYFSIYLYKTETMLWLMLWIMSTCRYECHLINVYTRKSLFYLFHLTVIVVPIFVNVYWPMRLHFLLRNLNTRHREQWGQTRKGPGETWAENTFFSPHTHRKLNTHTHTHEGMHTKHSQNRPWKPASGRRTLVISTAQIAGCLKCEWLEARRRRHAGSCH